MKKSEFGKGLSICLAKFLEHFGSEQLRYISFLDLYKNKPKLEQKVMISDNPPDNLNYGNLTDYLKFYIKNILPIYKNNMDKAISREIELWASGASDHLYEIETPEGDDWNEIREMVDKLKDKGLEIGHGARDKMWKLKDINELKELTFKILLKIDEKIGLNPDIGQW